MARGNPALAENRPVVGLGFMARVGHLGPSRTPMANQPPLALERRRPCREFSVHGLDQDSRGQACALHRVLAVAAHEVVEERFVTLEILPHVPLCVDRLDPEPTARAQNAPAFGEQTEDRLVVEVLRSGGRSRRSAGFAGPASLVGGFPFRGWRLPIERSIGPHEGPPVSGHPFASSDACAHTASMRVGEAATLTLE